MSTKKATPKAATKRAIRKSSGKKLVQTVKQTPVIHDPLPGATIESKPALGVDWFTLKYEVNNRRIELCQFGMKLDALRLSYRDKKLLDEAIKDALDSLEEHRHTVEDEGLSDAERLAAHRKAMQYTKDYLIERAANIHKEALAAVEDYLKAEYQHESYSEVMSAVDDLLFENGISDSDRTDFRDLIKELTTLLFVPEVGTRFYSMTKFKPEQVAKYMTRLTKFFAALGNDPVEADIERYSLKEAPSRYSYSDLEWMKFNYTKQAAKSRAALQIDEQFDNG